MYPLVVELSQGEQTTARWLAGQRHAQNRAGGVKDRQVGPQSAEATDLEGIGAELAFCLMWNVWPDLSPALRRGGHDATLRLQHEREGLMDVRFDVKATQYQQGKLVAYRGKTAIECGAYALMVGVFPRYRMAGWAWATDLLRASNLTDLGHGECYAMVQPALMGPAVLDWMRGS